MCDVTIGNFSPNNPQSIRFVMEYVCDWQLFHRTKEELFDFARSIPKQEIDSMTIEQEPLGINYFLVIRKKSGRRWPSRPSPPNGTARTGQVSRSSISD